MMLLFVRIRRYRILADGGWGFCVGGREMRACFQGIFFIIKLKIIGAFFLS